MSLLWKISLTGEDTGRLLFKKLSQTEAKCNANQQKMKLSNHGTSTLKSHLAKHPLYLRKFDELEKEKKSQTESMQQGLAKFVFHGKGGLEIKLTCVKDNGKTYAILAKVTRRFLSAPATSQSSEQIFSVARDVYDYRRISLSRENAEMPLFLIKNLPLLNYEY